MNTSTNWDGTMIIGTLLIAIIYSIACLKLTGRVAAEKGYDRGSWEFAGLFLGILALIAVAGLPLNTNQVKNNNTEPSIDYTRKFCQNCGKTINSITHICDDCKE